MFARYTDPENQLGYSIDFARRNRGSLIVGSIIAFILAYILIITPLYFANKTLFLPLAFINFVVMTILACTVIFKIKINNELIEATEFQNTVLTSTLKGHSEFCFILREDGLNFYSDNNFETKFSKSCLKGIRNLDALLESNIIPEEQKQQIREILKAPDYKPMTLPFTYENQLLALFIIPITVNSTYNAEKIVSKFHLIQLISLTHPDFLIAFEQYFLRMPLAIYACDKDQRLTYVNDRFCQLIGLTRTDILNNKVNLSSLILKSNIIDNEQGKEVVLRKADYTTINVVEKNLHLSNQQYYILFESNNTSLPNNNANSLWQLIETSPIAELIIDQYGIVEKYNLAFKLLTRTSTLPDRGWYILDTIDADNKDEAAELLSQVATNEQVNSIINSKPITIKLNGLKERTLLLYIDRMRALKDEQAKLIVRLIDITEQKNLELHIAHSQKMQAVGQLAGGIAHDFNNLLTAMIGFSDLLLMRHPPGDQSFADIMQIKQNANRAANLIRQLLAFSRKQILQPVVLDITDILDESSNLIRRLIGENITLDIQHGRDLRLVKADQVQLEQVIINLAVNARDAMSNQGNLTIKTQNVDINDNSNFINGFYAPTTDDRIEPGEYVLIEVTDTGCGIPKHLIGKIFEPFFSTKELGAGTGLGLSTVYGIVKQTGGYIYLQTEKGKGTKFYIFLKGDNNKTIGNNIETDSDGEKFDKINTDQTGSGTILIVEDETPVRVFAAHALMNKGYTIFEAENGQEAIDIMDKFGDKIDIIITDVIMPGLNGPAMAEEIATKYPNIKVIFMSGYAEDSFINTYGPDRSFNFLPKPFSLKQLAIKVKEVMNKKNEL